VIHTDSGPGTLVVPGLDIREGPPLPDVGLGPAVDAGADWPDVHGNTAARTAVHASGASVELVGLARYALHDGEAVATAWPGPGRSHTSVTDGYHRSAAPMLMTHRGAQQLHASAVATSAGVVVLCATSGTGKSTTAAALGRLGYPLWADDAVVFAAGTGSERPSSVRLSVPLRLDDAGAGLIATLPASPRSPRPTVPGEVRPLARILILERLEASEPTMEPLSSGEALTGLLRHALCLTPRRPATQRGLAEDYLSVISSVPVHRLSFEPGRASFSALIEALVAALPD